MRASSLPSPPSKEGGGQIEIATTITPKPRIKLTEKSNKANKLPRARYGTPSKEQGGQIEIATTITPEPRIKLTEK